MTTPKSSQVALCRGGGGKSKVKGKETTPLKEGGDKSDLLIQYLWTPGMDSIHDMRVMNTGAVSYQSKTPENYLDTANRDKKKTYLNACFNERRHFNTFFASVDVIIGDEAEATLKRIVSRLA